MDPNQQQQFVQSSLSPVSSMSLKTNRNILSESVHDCMYAIATMTNCLRMLTFEPPSPESSIPGDTGPAARPKDSASVIALETSILRACARCDRLMGDDSKWQLPAHDIHDTGIKYFNQQILLRQQDIRANEVRLKSLEQQLEMQRDLIQEELRKQVAERLDELERTANEDPTIPPAQQ